MFPEFNIVKSKSELAYKTNEKQRFGPKTILTVLLVIFLMFALFLPFRKYSRNRKLDLHPAYSGDWYRPHARSSNSSHVYIKAPIKGYIKLQLDPLSGDRILSDTGIIKTDTSTKKETCFGANSSDTKCYSRQKRGSKKKKDGPYTEVQYYKDAYDAYLKCLAVKDEKYFETMARKPNVELGEEDTTIILKCNMCLQPGNDYDKYNYKWQRFLKFSPNQTWEDVKEEEEHFEIDPVSGDLVLNKMLEEDSGRYICYVRNTEFQAVHYLDVLGLEKTRQVFDDSVTPSKDVKQLQTSVKNNQTDKKAVKLFKAAPAEPVPALNLLLLTSWAEWTKCSRCGIRGERARHGQCTVKIGDPEKDTDYEILKRFPEGLPCRSSLVPSKLADVKQVQERYSENELGYCIIECPKAPEKVLDANGDAVKVFRNPLKNFKRPKWLPKLPKLVVRRVYYVVVGKKTALKCPNTQGGQAVRWSNGSEVYDRVQLAQDVQHRVSIDTQSRLLIHHLAKSDTAVYTCFVYGKLQGSIKLKVVPAYKEEGVSEWITTAGLVCTVLLIFYLGFTLCQQERNFGKVMR